MKLEELIQKRFTEREELTKFLAKFGDYPAVFSPEAPKDSQDWGTDVHYPRIVYNYDMQADEERKSAGTLSVSLLCQNTEDATEEDITPEMLEPLVRDCLKDVLLHSDDGKLYAFAWNRTDTFELRMMLSSRSLSRLWNHRQCLYGISRECSREETVPKKEWYTVSVSQADRLIYRISLSEMLSREHGTLRSTDHRSYRTYWHWVKRHSAVHRRVPRWHPPFNFNNTF